MRIFAAPMAVLRNWVMTSTSCACGSFTCATAKAAFMERTIGTAQLLLAKPAAINPPLLGRFIA